MLDSFGKKVKRKYKKQKIYFGKYKEVTYT